jgi:hypothetical protein
MTDPKDELGARFEDRRPDDTKETESKTGDSTEDTSSTDNVSDSNNSDNTGDSNNKPGPDRDEDATRHKRQVPMYLPEEKASQLNGLYERLDGRSKVAGDGGIEKHADFMETLVEFAADNEDEMASRLGIDPE